MPTGTHNVNLDALVKRQDFGTSDASITEGDSPVFKLDELEKGKTYFSLLRKPDFQRTTDNWTSEMIVEFVRSFLDKELIPSIIIWHAKDTEKIFLIDGAHRISALIAWVNDDYGDGPISRTFFGEDIPTVQKRLDKMTRELMEQTVGTYRDLVVKSLSPVDESDIRTRRGRAIFTRAPPLQRVEGGADVAEKSFLRINGTPAIIDPTELDIIKARRKPNAIATRALMQAGKGYQYWARFSGNAERITKLSAEVYELLFGEVVEITTLSPDVPRAGQPYSAEAFKMVLDIVNIFNNVTPAMWQEPKSKRRSTKPRPSAAPRLADDHDGSQTVAYLERIKAVGQLVCDASYSGSLGLDQAVYSYGPDKFYTSAHLAALKFAEELKTNNKLFVFTAARRDFEDFLVRHKSFIKDISHGKGSRTRPLESLLAMHRIVLDGVIAKMKDEEVVKKLLDNPGLKKSLKVPDPAPTIDEPEHVRKRKRFSKAVQQARVLQTTLDNRERCKECGARLPPAARSKDHIKPVEEGGESVLENLQFTHPYCNSGYKEAKRAQVKKEATGEPLPTV